MNGKGNGASPSSSAAPLSREKIEQEMRVLDREIAQANAENNQVTARLSQLTEEKRAEEARAAAEAAAAAERKRNIEQAVSAAADRKNKLEQSVTAATERLRVLGELRKPFIIAGHGGPKPEEDDGPAPVPAPAPAPAFASASSGPRTAPAAPALSRPQMERLVDQVKRAIPQSRMNCMLAPGGTFYPNQECSSLPADVEKVVLCSVSIETPDDGNIVVIKTHLVQVVGQAPRRSFAAKSDARNALSIRLRCADVDSPLARGALERTIEQVCNICGCHKATSSGRDGWLFTTLLRELRIDGLEEFREKF